LGENPQAFPARNAGLNLGGKGELCRAGRPEQVIFASGMVRGASARRTKLDDSVLDLQIVLQLCSKDL
jgi:hypothetical protein